MTYLNNRGVREMETAIKVGGTEITKVTTENITKSICDIFEQGAITEVSEKTIRHGLSVFESIAIKSATTENITISNCTFTNES